MALALAGGLVPLTDADAATPAYRASGTFTSGTGNIAPPYPASMVADDVCLLAVESENQAISLSIANGFVQVPTWSPQSAGTAGTNPASRLALYWKRTVGGDLAPTVLDSGDHTTGQIHCFSGVIKAGNPWDVGAGGNDGGANDTTGTIPGATTTVDETLVVLITSTSFNGNSTANCSAWNNGNLGSLTERTDNAATAGLGGGHCMATGTMATAGTYASTTVTMANTTYKGAISLALRPPRTTLGDGTDAGLGGSVGPGGSATMADAFTFQTSAGTDTVTAIQVVFATGTAAGLSLVEITNDGGTIVYGSAANPADTQAITLTTNITATTTSTQYKIRVTPRTHANMPVPPGAVYAVTARVNSWTSSGTPLGSDAAGATVTIDNASPASATLFSCTAGNAKVTLGWTTSSSSDFSRSVVLRWDGSSAGTEVPAEGTDYTVVPLSTIGSATVVCVRTGDSGSTSVSDVDGSGGVGCSTTALTNGQTYTYKLFQKDTSGNYDTGTSSTSCTPTAVTSFNGCESSSCTPVLSPLTYAALYTKLADTAFTQYGVALKSDGTLASSFTGNVTVDLLANINAGVTLGGNNCPGSQDATISLGTVSFSGGRATLSWSVVGSAYRDVRLRFTCAAGVCGSAITQCSSDNFAIRPRALVLSSSNANADTAGTNANATPAFKTGASFNLTATGGASYNGTPKIDPTKIGIHSGGVQAGTLSPNIFSAAAPASGQAVTNFTYSEVGYFNLATYGLYDDGFTGVDQSAGDCTNDFSILPDPSGKYGCKFGNTSASVFVGRFVPDHFALTAGSLIDRAGINTGASETCASSFTYMGEDFKTTFTLEAQNSGNTTTQNYTGSHAKFGLTAWANYAFSASGGSLAVGSVVPSGSWGSTVGNYGKANVTATHLLTRPGSPTAPVTGLVISAQPSYTDGTATYGLGSSTAVHAGNTEQRYGRLRILNAYGSELLPLRVPARTEYYDGTTWLLNSADSCTSLAANTVALSGGISANTSASAVTLAAGSGTLTLAKPSPAATGLVDLSINLGTTGTTNTTSCNPSNPAATAANMPWLQFAWCSGKLDPNARVRFGSPRAPVIFQRERY